MRPVRARRGWRLTVTVVAMSQTPSDATMRMEDCEEKGCVLVAGCGDTMLRQSASPRQRAIASPPGHARRGP